MTSYTQSETRSETGRLPRGWRHLALNVAFWLGFYVVYQAARGLADRDVTTAWTFTPELVPVFAGIYADPQKHWAAYETCEELVDLEDNFQLWRFRHLKTVERIIGLKSGTGGSSGASFLRRALELTFFPELFAVRTEI